MTKLFSKLSSLSSSPSLEGRGRGWGSSPSQQGRGLGGEAVLLLLFLTLLTACTGNSQRAPKSAADLIADADHFQVDTIVATPDDTLVSTSVDAVLRHYPELYRAAEKAQQVYSKWALQEQQAQVCQTAMLDIRNILSATLGSETVHADTLPSLEQLAETTSKAYLRLISEAPADRKTAIGHSRKAFLAYADQLQQVAQALPDDLRERYAAIVARQISNMKIETRK